MKLLICDDDILTVDVIESHLDRAGLGITQILRAYNGEAAKHVIAAEEPELVLCDIGMPLCDGIEVLKYVYDNRFETEFSLLTCHEDFEYAKAALQYGASHYITKPFEMEELAGVLRSMIEEATKKRGGPVNGGTAGKRRCIPEQAAAAVPIAPDGRRGRERMTLLLGIPT